jgi:murein DD-endopeptidase MepM/ murein hydrolase activator NlpD
MRTRVAACESKRVLKVIVAALLASASAACSSDSSRFGENPFTNPFSTASTAKVDRTTTNSLPSRSAPVGSVTSQPLPAALPRVSNPLNPAQSAAAPQTPALPRVASATLQQAQAAPIGGTAAGWTATGGTPVTVGAGETASTLSARYGVPAAAITAANGGQIRSGQQAIIPVYNGQGAPSRAAAAAAPASAPAAAPAPVAAAPVPPRPVAAVAPLPQARPAAIAAAKPANAVRPAKPEADDDEDETPKKIVAAAPAKQLAAPAKPATAPAKPVVAAAKPLKPAEAPKKSQDDDDDEDETPKKAETAPKLAPKPALAQAKPQPRVIPLTTQAPKPEEAPVRAAQADTTTTQSIPAPKPAPAPAPEAAAGDKADFRWPARGRVISGFGSKGGNGDGIAIAVPEGTPVKAAGDGVVAYAGEELKGYGKLVLVRHDNGYVSAYAHNGDLAVKRGEKVSRGQTIAKSGSTGNVTSPQLHFELRKGSTPVDPTKYLEN